MSADTSRVTRPCGLDLWPFDLEQLSYMAGHVTNLANKFEDPMRLCLSVLELWVITFPAGYHWKCVRDHCACAESRDPWVRGQKQLHFGILDPDLLVHYTAFIGLRRRLRVVYSRASPMLKPLIAFISCAWPCDLDLWPFNLEQL